MGAFLSVLLVGFEGWLGKLVVDTHLKTGMITIHMAVAMLLLMLLLALRFRAFPQIVEGVVFPLRTRILGMATLALLLIQILLGTQVREAVDVLAHTLGEGSRTTWVQQLGSAFLYHSNLYFVVVAMMGYWIYDMRETLTAHIYVKKYALLLGVLTAIEILAGILLANFALPPALQPLHLVIATAMVAVLAWIIALMFVRAPKTLS
jgi:cytochrome c oxidase assembly protein subunit 15